VLHTAPHTVYELTDGFRLVAGRDKRGLEFEFHRFICGVKEKKGTTVLFYLKGRPFARAKSAKDWN
jgi:hypothetical protein